jgi:hypothetical protein
MARPRRSPRLRAIRQPDIGRGDGGHPDEVGARLKKAANVEANGT